MENSEAGKLLNSIHGPSSRAVYHPERLRKNRYSLTIAASGSGGVNDMQEIGCGKDWEDAFADMWKQSITELEAKLAALDWKPITEGYTVPGEWESKCVLITHESSVKIGFQTTSYDWCVDGRVLKVRPTAWKPLPEPFVAMEGK